jgi:hypothetical protein
MNAPLTPPENAEALQDIAWWAAERARAGTDWRTFLLHVVRALKLVTPCPVCGSEPCPLPSFCQLVRKADATAGSKRRQWDGPRPTPTATVEALSRQYAIGASQLSENRPYASACRAAMMQPEPRLTAGWLVLRERADEFRESSGCRSCCRNRAPTS